jgi:predicted metal-dependent phosphoesterase TrpH
MHPTTHGLTLAPDAAIDMQTHTIFSDGRWQPDALIGHAAAEGFGLIAVTDHDRPDTAGEIQRIAREKNQPVMVAVELTTTWRGEYTDILCYGYDPAAAPLLEICAAHQRRQRDNTALTFENLTRRGYALPDDETAEILALPAAAQPFAVVGLLQRHGLNTHERSAGTLAKEAGITFETIDIITAIEAAHASGGVCIVAHPGRGVEFTKYDAALLDELRQTVPIDGIEAYYPRHSAEQMSMFVEYAAKHNLFVSAGSDSHSPDRLPIPYPAANCRALLERLGITIR